jgi:putative oxidoreductase
MNLLTNTMARILFGLPFIAFGIGHLMNASKMGGMVPIPGGVIWIYVTGIAMILAGIAAITKFQGKWAMLLLALLLLIYIVTIHIPNLMKPETLQMGLLGLYKDTGLMAGALLLAGIFDKETKKVQAA